MSDFKGRFTLNQYMNGKPTKWGMKALVIADSKKTYLLKCKIYLGNKKEETVSSAEESYWHYQGLHGTVAPCLFWQYIRLI
jgi:hypothetical protein